MKENKFYYLILILFTMIILFINYNNNIHERIRKEIQVNDVEMTEDGILIQLDINGELEYYFYECE